MLDYIKKLLRATAVSDDKNSVRNPMVGEPSFGDEVFSKLSKEKKVRRASCSSEGKS